VQAGRGQIDPRGDILTSPGKADSRDRGMQIVQAKNSSMRPDCSIIPNQLLWADRHARAGSSEPGPQHPWASVIRKSNLGLVKEFKTVLPQRI